MEDILSSIKRIIAEDSDAALSGPRIKRSVGLSPLTRAERVDEGFDEEEILELTDPVAVEPEPEPEPEPVVLAIKPTPAPKAKVNPVPADLTPTLVSSTTAEAT